MGEIYFGAWSEGMDIVQHGSRRLRLFGRNMRLLTYISTAQEVE